MIIPENKEERKELKESLWQQQLNEEHILVVTKGIIDNIQHNKEMIERCKELGINDVEIEYINTITKNMENEEQIWNTIQENHKQKWKCISQEHEKIVEYDNQQLDNKLQEENKIDSYDAAFTEVATMLMNSRYIYLKLIKTEDKNKWQIIHTKTNHIIHEAEPKKMIETIKEITNNL